MSTTRCHPRASCADQVVDRYGAAVRTRIPPPLVINPRWGTHPVVCELSVPTLLIVGEHDEPCVKLKSKEANRARTASGYKATDRPASTVSTWPVM